MATESGKNDIKRAQRTTDPAEQDGGDVETADGLKDAQTAGSRNDRATEYSVVKHDTEPYGADQTAGAEQKDTGHSVGITSKKLGEELKADSYVKPHAPKGNEGAFGDDEREESVGGKLPSGEAERIETVEVSTMTPHK